MTTKNGPEVKLPLHFQKAFDLAVEIAACVIVRQTAAHLVLVRRRLVTARQVRALQLGYPNVDKSGGGMWLGTCVSCCAIAGEVQVSVRLCDSGGGFRFFSLSVALVDEGGMIRDSVDVFDTTSLLRKLGIQMPPEIV